VSKFRSLKNKIITVAAIGVVIIGGILVGYSAISTRNLSIEHAETFAAEASEKYARELSYSLEKAFEGTYVT